MNTADLIRRQRKAAGGVVSGESVTIQPARRLRGLTFKATVMNTSAEMLPGDFDRRFLFVQNNHATGTITLSFGGDKAALNVGIVLQPNGGAILLDAGVPSAALFAIGSVVSNADVVVIVA